MELLLWIRCLPSSSVQLKAVELVWPGSILERRLASPVSASGTCVQSAHVQTGIYRFYPANVWGASSSGFCSEYDPRKRPWYVAAASGAKRLILILDVSGSMAAGVGSNTRINIAKLAAREVLATLTNADYFAIVVFSSDARKMNTRLLRGTASNIDAAYSWIDSNVIASGRTFPDTAFTAAFDILDASAQAEIGSSACRSVMLFMSDGDPTDNSGNDALNVLRARTATPAGRDAFVFSYSLGAEASKDFPKQIACENNGVWARITNTRDLISAMAGYYEFIAAGLSRSTAVWTESYVDALGLGLVTTAAFPAYDRTTDPPTLVGIAGVDVKMADFLSTGASASDTLDVLVARSSLCGSFNATYCTLEKLRGAERCDSSRFQAQCGTANADDTCPDSASGDAFCAASSQVYTSTAGYTSAACCEAANSASDDGTAVSGAVVGGVAAGVVLVVLVAAFAFMRSRKQAKPPSAAGPTPHTASAGMPAQATHASPVSAPPSAPSHLSAPSAGAYPYGQPPTQVGAQQAPPNYQMASLGYYASNQAPAAYGHYGGPTQAGGPRGSSSGFA